MRLVVSPSFAQLQHDPQSVWIACDVVVHDLPPVMADDEEAVENPEGQRRHRKEVHCGDCFAMIAEKRKPAPGWIRILACTFDPTRNGSFRDVETQFEQLAVDARRSPRWVLSDHPKDQLAHFPADWSSSDCPSSSRDPTPVQSKAGPMPANHGFRGDKDQRPLPARPDFSQNHPEQLVDGTQSRTRSLCVQSQQLLTKGEVLQQEFFSGAKDGENPAEQMSKAHKHQGIIAKSAPDQGSDGAFGNALD